MIFNRVKLNEAAHERRPAYAAAEPFPHAVIDGLADVDALGLVERTFRAAEGGVEWYCYDNPLEKKRAYPHAHFLPVVLRSALEEMNANPFVSFLELLTGIDGLVPDPGFNGGGLHLVDPGGKLDVHADYNFHPRTRLDRRVNAVLYLNEGWGEADGGKLELWDRGMARKVVEVAPEFNRLVVFSTTDDAFHGQPEPAARPRRSLATYYYTNGRPEAERSAPHSTVFRKRPGEPEDAALDDLRARRARGRLSS